MRGLMPSTREVRFVGIYADDPRSYLDASIELIRLLSFKKENALSPDVHASSMTESLS